MKNWKLVTGALLALNVLAIALALLSRRSPDHPPAARVLEGHRYWVQHLAFAPDGQTLASAAGELHRGGEVKLWDLATGRERTTLAGHTASVEGVAFAPDGQQLATASWDQTIQLWDLASGQPRTTLQLPAAARAVALTPDGQTLASAENNFTVRFWDLGTGRQRAACPGWSHLAFAPDGQTLAVTNRGCPGVKVCDAVTLQERTRLCVATGAVVGLAYSPDGRLLAGASSDETVHVWEVATGQLRHTLRGHTDRVYSVAFAPDGQTLASAGQTGP
jgi:WD40 repeat protein